MPSPRTRALRLPLGRCTATGSAGADVLAGALVVCALAVAFGPWPAAVRAVTATAFIAVAASRHRVLALKNRSSRRARRQQAWLVIDDAGIQRVDSQKQSTLVEWREPFGVTVLASADRAAIIVALTSPRAARYVPARVADSHEASLAPNLIRRATTAPDSDLPVAGQAGLSAADAERLLAEIAHRAPAALDRAYLSDASGEPLVLDRTELCIGTRRIDLSAPLEWRAFLFQERGPNVLSLCQATWVRQGDAEVVLVAPIPADCAWVPAAGVTVCEAGDEQAVLRGVARDVRLMPAEVGDPPPRELRRAVDRLFMIPLRLALDRAPRDVLVPSTSTSASFTLPVGRA